MNRRLFIAKLAAGLGAVALLRNEPVIASEPKSLTVKEWAEKNRYRFGEPVELARPRTNPQTIEPLIVSVSYAYPIPDRFHEATVRCCQCGHEWQVAIIDGKLEPLRIWKQELCPCLHRTFLMCQIK